MEPATVAVVAAVVLKRGLPERAGKEGVEVSEFSLWIRRVLNSSEIRSQAAMEVLAEQVAPVDLRDWEGRVAQVLKVFLTRSAEAATGEPGAMVGAAATEEMEPTGLHSQCMPMRVRSSHPTTSFLMARMQKLD